MSNLSKTVTSRWQDSLNVVLGVWLLISPWILGFAAIEAAMWNALVLGVVVIVASLASLVRYREWEEWADIVFGIWLVISPWVLGVAALSASGAGAATWNFVIVGILTIALAAWSVWHERHHASPAT